MITINGTPLLITLKGHPGSGKSAVGRALGRRLGIPLIDKDDIKDILDGLCDDPGGLAYTAMFNIARRQLMLGLSVICDSPLSEPGGYTAASCAAHDALARMVVIECFCSSQEEWQRRIEARSALRLPDHHVTTWADLEAHLRKRRLISNYAISEPHLVIDTLSPLDEVIRRILAWLEQVDKSAHVAAGDGRSS
jgi:predicted kinase